MTATSTSPTSTGPITACHESSIETARSGTTTRAATVRQSRPVSRRTNGWIASTVPSASWKRAVARSRSRDWSDRAGNEQKIEARDSGQFRFTVGEKKKSYKFRVVLPHLGETNISLPATGGWLTLRVISKQFARVEEKPREPMGELCKVESGSCTLFLFDYLHDQISGDELQAFHNFQTDRLDKGIRNYLSSRNLLEGLSFRVKRCSATAVNDSSRAAEAAGLLKVPAVLWGFIKRADNKLISATTITMVDGQPMNLGTREVLGNDVTELIGLDRPVLGTPLAMASFVVGDIHLRQGRADLARRAFLDALELAGGLDPHDKVEFMQAVNRRLQKLERSNPAAGLTPIGDPNG